jgi:hypothetical protein
MAHTHEFDCPVCGAHLDSRKELQDHTRDQHSQQGSSKTNRDEPRSAK